LDQSTLPARAGFDPAIVGRINALLHDVVRQEDAAARERVRRLG
jgi:hypothetical protein